MNNFKKDYPHIIELIRNEKNVNWLDFRYSYPR